MSKSRQARLLARNAHFRHEATLYDSLERATAMLLPFLLEGLERRVPTYLRVEPELDGALREELGQRSIGLADLGETAYTRPLRTLQSDLNLFRSRLASGDGEVRLVASVPHPGNGEDDWLGWVRFECAANHFFAGLPVSMRCAYDRRTAPEEVLRDVEATHPTMTAPHGSSVPSPRYSIPEEVYVARAEDDVDPIERTRPAVELDDPTTAEARHAVQSLARDVPLRMQDVSALSVAADEAVANARLHGQGGVTARIWRGDDRLAVAVQDEGPGPPSPYEGLVAAPDRQGMWLLHQLCTRVSTTAGPDGFTVHLVTQADTPRRG